MASHSPQVIVIGAGIIGSSIAWRLAQAGAAVTLVDAGAPGNEASWAGAGMLAPGGEIESRTPWTELALRSLAQYPGFVAELQAESGVTIDYQHCGATEFAYTEAEWRQLLARRAAQQELGIRVEVAEPGSGAAGALSYPDDALVNPRDITRALATACRRHNVRVCPNTAVTAIRLAVTHVEVVTAAHTESAGVAVLAAGAWSSRIPVLRAAEAVRIPVSFPVRGHLLGYSLAPGSLGPILRHGHTYVMQRSNGFTIAGTSSEQVGFDRALDQAVIADIRARATRLVPLLRVAPEPEAWLGFRPATEDFEPRVTRLPDSNLWLAYGHYRNGILLSPITAEMVSSQILSS